MTPRTTYRVTALAALAALLVGMLTVHGGALIDDAYISLRYADNLAQGRGLVFNPGERVEGYSNFLWVILLAAAGRLGAPMPLAAQILGGVATIAAFGAFVWWVRELLAGTEPTPTPPDSATATVLPLVPSGAVAFFALEPAIAIWATNGLETPLVAFLLLLVALAYYRRRYPAAAVTALALGVLRPEGIAAGAGLILLRAWEHRRDTTRPNAREWLALAILAVGYGAYTAWRWRYFGSLTPTAAAAKVDLLGPVWGTRYALAFVLQRPVFAVLALAGLISLMRPRPAPHSDAERLLDDTAATRRQWLPLLVPAGAYTAALLAAGGDWMPHFRFLVPALPVAIVLACHAVRTGLGHPSARMRAGVAAVGASAVLLAGAHTAEYVLTPSFHKDWHTHQDRFYAEPARWVADNMAPGSLLAVDDIGHIAWRTPVRVLDTQGLIDPHLAALRGSAAHTTDVDYILDRRPDVIIRMVNEYPGGAIGHLAFDRAVAAAERFSREYQHVTTLPGYNAEEDVLWPWTEPQQYAVVFEVYRRKDATPTLSR